MSQQLDHKVALHVCCNLMMLKSKSKRMSLRCKSYTQLADTIFNSITKSLSCNTRVMLPYDQVVATLNGFKDNPNFSHALYYVRRKITRLQLSNDSMLICNYLSRNMQYQ